MKGRGEGRGTRGELKSERAALKVIPRPSPLTSPFNKNGAIMIPELGQSVLIIALCIALVQAVLPDRGAARGNDAWMNVARPAAQGTGLSVAIAFSCLAYSFITNDFSVLNVATNSNSSLPAHYRIAATWGSHEGSLLLWMLMLSIWMLAVTLFSRSLPDDMVARILGVMGLIAVGFLLFMLFTSNPFERLLPAAADGRDLNPLLQDPGMVFHPPMLYMGYVGFSVAFAFAVAALIGGASWTPPGHAGRDRGPRWRGCFSPSASPSAAAGPTTSSAGAAGGSGIRWRTPRSCPG